MALKATIFKATVEITDLDRAYYASHDLTLARHPSETDERMMLRLAAFVLFADDRLAFGRGLSTRDEPALWSRSLAGDIEHWIDVGQPDEQDVRRACGRAARVTVVTFGGRTAELWWERHGPTLSRLTNLTVIDIAQAESGALAELAARTMRWTALVQDGELNMMGDHGSALLRPGVRRQREGGSAA